MRAIGFNRILCNYDALLMAWEEFLDDQKLGSEIRGRIIGVQAQMNLFFFIFLDSFLVTKCIPTLTIFRSPYSPPTCLQPEESLWQMSHLK